MNSRQITYFCEVVDAGSIVLAAKRLFIAPTAITMQVAQLEADLGGALFDRKRRPMELTSLGKFFYPRAKALLRQALRLEEETRGLAAGKHGWIGIGFVRSVIYSVLPRAVRTFRAAFPDVQMDLVEMLSEYQPQKLRSGRIQLGISRFVGPFNQPEDLCYRVLFNDPFVAVLPCNHPLAQSPSLHMAELAATSFIGYPNDPNAAMLRCLLAMLSRAGIKPRLGYEAIEIQTALGLVAAGLGFTLVGASVAENNRTDVSFIPVLDLPDTSQVVAITNAGQEDQLVESFLEILARQTG
jgi:DNA-binding transcriptional LysR family regulator